MIKKESFYKPNNSDVSFHIAGWAEIEPLLNSDVSSTIGTFQFRNMDYSYRDWLDSSEDDRRRNFGDTNISSLQYDKLLIIDLFGGNDDLDWNSLYENENRLIIMLEDIYNIVNNVAHGSDSDEEREIITQLYDAILSQQDLFEDRDALNHSQVVNRGYGSTDTHPLLSALNRTFYVQPWQYPSGVEISMEDVGYIRRRTFMATAGPKFWKDMPLRYLMLPLPSEDFIEYYTDTNETDVDSIDANYLLWSSNLTNLYQCSSGNGYYDSDNHDHARFFDYHEMVWKPREHRWGGRGYRECTVCRLMYNTHFLTWMKSMDGYNNSTRDRICFLCNTFITSSYNPVKKAWVKYGPKVSYDSNEQYQGMRNDYYVNYIHGNDSPRARGSRDYMVKYIDDSTYQDIEVFNDEDIQDAVKNLQVDARKYLTWMYKSFKGVPGDIKSQVISDNVEFRILEDSTAAGRHNQNGDVAGYINDDPDEDSLSGADYARMVGLQLPNVYIYSSVNPLADTIISLRIDSKLYDREFGYSSRNRSGRYAQTRVIDDGWLEPPGIGLELDKEKKEYNYAPRFYYVHYRDGKYYNYPVDAPMMQVNTADRCPCTSDECREHDKSHPVKPEWHDTRGVSLGLELEVIARDSRLLNDVGPLQLFERTVEIFHPKNLENMIGDRSTNQQLLYAKRDGSLPNDTGVEYISQPMTLDAWHAVPQEFWNFVEANYKAFQVEDVGIHIHFPWASMEIGHAYAMLSALNSLQINPYGLLRKVAQRPDVSYSRWDLLTFRDAYNVVAEVAKQRTRSDNEKYKGINLQHSNTIELRYFQSNAKGDRVLKNLEFIDAIYELTKKDYLTSGGWDVDRDMPSTSLIEIATEYGNQSTKAKIDNVHAEDVPFANHIERRIYDYVLGNNARYRNLVSFLRETDEDADNDSAELSIEDIGYWDIPVAIEEDNVNEELTFFNNRTFVFSSPTITVDDTEYTQDMVQG